MGGGGGQGGCKRRIEVFGGRVGWGIRVDVYEEMKFLGKFKIIFFWGEGLGRRGGGVSGLGGGQGGCERRIEVFGKIHKKTRMMFIKHYAPNRCLCIKVANSIDHWVEDCRDVTKAGGGGICTKNGSYCEKEKKVRGGGSG